jgi:hypothetical protein
MGTKHLSGTWMGPGRISMSNSPLCQKLQVEGDLQLGRREHILVSNEWPSVEA